LRLLDATKPVLPFNTVMDTQGRLTYAPNHRSRHTETLLADGRVLFTGGSGPDWLTAVIFDPATKTYTPTANGMIVPRERHTATLLPDGRVLIVGGVDYNWPNNQVVGTVEIFDPATNTFAADGAILTPRAEHTAVPLDDGSVFIAGGNDWLPDSTTPTSTEIYTPGATLGTGFAIAGPTLARPREYHTATKLIDGRVLIAGGHPNWTTDPHAEIYTPSSGLIAPAGPMVTPRAEHTATLLEGGRVLLTGGWAGNAPGEARFGEIFDPADDTFTAAGALRQPRRLHTATLLPDDTVLLAGGIDDANESIAALEIFDPLTSSFSSAGGLATIRGNHTATTLADGRVLLAFGDGRSSITGHSIEVYDPASPPPAPPIEIQNGALPTAHVSQPYDVQLAATGTSPWVWSLAPGSAAMPSGLTLSTDGHLAGTPDPVPPGVWQIFCFTVRVQDFYGLSVARTMCVLVE
jgi:hypothetical protein